ncbi:hypothetical protein ANN_18906, partial [Periplaneta americana]
MLLRLDQSMDVVRMELTAETLAHVLGYCPLGELLRITRPHRIRSKIAAALFDMNNFSREAWTCKKGPECEAEVTGGQEGRSDATRTGNMCPSVELTDEGMCGLCLRVVSKMTPSQVRKRDDLVYVRELYFPYTTELAAEGNDNDDRRPPQILAPQRGPTAADSGAPTWSDRRRFWRPNVVPPPEI